MENIEKFKEEIKKQLLNVKLMSNKDIRYKKYYNMTEEEKDKDNPFVIEYYDPTKDETYFKILEFIDGYKTINGYVYYIICECPSYNDSEIKEMKIEYWNDGDFHIFADYTTTEYWGNINNI